jgi:hypothetical protein
MLFVEYLKKLDKGVKDDILARCGIASTAARMPERNRH